MRRVLTIAATMLLAVLIGAPAASACGFLVSANGAVNLGKTTTLVVWEDGVEHYVTNFEFAGDAESFGSIIPLPAIPTDVGKAGEWTLQRLKLEVAPPQPSDFALFAASTVAEDGAEVILRTQIDSLDVVVLRGGADDVKTWVNDNGFNLPDTAGTEHMFSFYGDRTQIWLASRFDAAQAAEDGFVSGDGIPVQITMPVDRPWVPLHILHGASPDSAIIEADVFLITPDRPNLLYGEGLSIERSERASTLLLDDLRSDENMEWVPDSGWFTYLALNTEAENVVYDLAIGVDGEAASFIDAGFTKFEPTQRQLRAMGLSTETNPTGQLLIVVLVGALAGALGAAFVVNRRRHASDVTDI